MDDDESNIPRGRLTRVARLAKMGLRTGASIVTGRAADAAAAEAARVLGELRGLATKAGQMASYVDGFIPEDQRAAFETAMKGLRNAAPTSSIAAIRGLIERELGAPVGTLFAAFDDVPMASASIGQVHRARLHDGRDVVVKVQHPGIDRAIEADLANASMMEGVVGVVGGARFDAEAVFSTVRARFREELDYRHEAERQKEFAALHAHDASVVIPRVIDDRTARRVITMELAHGRSFDEAVTADPSLRRQWCEVMWRFVFRTQLVGGMFNADPHPGNYLFGDDGKVVFLDFGCVQPITAWQRVATRKVHAAALAKDERAFRSSMAELMRSKPGRFEDILVGVMRRSFDPIFHAPFRISRAYVASVVGALQGMKQSAWTLKASEVFPVPPELLFTFRLQFGFFSVLARFDVEVDYASVERGFWDEVERAG